MVLKSSGGRMGPPSKYRRRVAASLALTTVSFAMMISLPRNPLVTDSILQLVIDTAPQQTDAVAVNATAPFHSDPGHQQLPSGRPPEESVPLSLKTQKKKESRIASDERLPRRPRKKPPTASQELPFSPWKKPDANFQVVLPQTTPVDFNNLTALSPPPPIKVPFPVFVASLFRSGQGSVYEYFRCGGQRAAKFRAKFKSDSTILRSIGWCAFKKLQINKPLFEGCGYKVDIFIGASFYENCFEPSLHGLENFAKFYPHGTILLSHRDPDAWIESVKRYHVRSWSWLESLKGCQGQQNELATGKFDLFQGQNVTDAVLLEFYHRHLAHVRQFAQEHPNITFVEIRLEDETTGQQLEDAVGISSQCWGNSNQKQKSKQK